MKHDLKKHSNESRTKEDDAAKTKAEEEYKKNLPYCLATAGPGPATYNLPPCIGFQNHDPSRWRGPAFSVLQRSFPNSSLETDVPGPMYDVRNCTRYGVIHTPSVKFQKSGASGNTKKMEPPRKVLGFQEEKISLQHYQMKGFTLAGRHYLTPKGYTPAPNQYKFPDSIGYKVPDLRRAPAYSMQSRFHTRPPPNTPGPTKYSVVDTNLYKTQPPRAIVSHRQTSKVDTDNPGPTAYKVNIKAMLPNAPAFSFGTKHSICAGTMRTPVDDTLDRF